jgi:hypothetical protein
MADDIPVHPYDRFSPVFLDILFDICKNDYRGNKN